MSRNTTNKVSRRYRINNNFEMVYGNKNIEKKYTRRQTKGSIISVTKPEINGSTDISPEPILLANICNFLIIALPDNKCQNLDLNFGCTELFF